MRAWWAAGSRSSSPDGRTLTASSIGQSPWCAGHGGIRAGNLQRSITAVSCGTRKHVGRASRPDAAGRVGRVRHRVPPAIPSDAEFCYQLHRAAMGACSTAA
jgi:hypothetical protein